MPSSSSGQTRIKPEPIEDEGLSQPRSPLSRHPARPVAISFSPYPSGSSEPLKPERTEPELIKSLLSHATNLLHTELSSSKAECAQLREENDELRKKCARMRYERDVVRWRVGLLSGRVVPASAAIIAMGEIDGQTNRRKRREEDDDERPVIRRRLDASVLRSFPTPASSSSAWVPPEQDEDATSESEEDEVDEFTYAGKRRHTAKTLYSSSSTTVDAPRPIHRARSSSRSVNNNFTDTSPKLEYPEPDLWSDGSGSQDMDLESQSDD